MRKEFSLSTPKRKKTEERGIDYSLRSMPRVFLNFEKQSVVVNLRTALAQLATRYHLEKPSTSGTVLGMRKNQEARISVVAGLIRRWHA